MTSATSMDAVDPKLWVWGSNDDKPRFLHTMIRVNDFDAALRFYVDGLGMKVFDRFDIASRRATAVFIGFDGYAAGGLMELTQNWDADGPYSHGTGYGHVSIGVPDIMAMVAKLEAMGAEITLRPKVLMTGGPHVAFVKDPDGYAVELIQTRSN